MLTPGDKAPAFTLKASDKSQVSLKDFRGQNVLLLFFPAAFTSVCTRELSHMRDNLEAFSALNTQIVAISVDTIFSLNQWKEEQKFNFPLLSDFNKTVSKRYGALYREFLYGMRGVSKRAAFVIDRDGVVQHLEILENAGEIPDFERIRQVLLSLHHS